MVTRKTITMATLLAILSVALVAPAAMLSADTTEVEIDVAPGTLNLSYNGQWVTVHTDLAYDSDTTGSLAWSLNGVGASSVFYDCSGNLVAQFDVQGFTVPNVISLGEQLMTLEGGDSGGTLFYSGSTTIRVIDVGKRQ